ncbi:hypothetical protein M0R45_003801 [Rubus argutus]|uniref:F-box domain-containing protein n=1 Tax=Rubus argutus TaxID=59490 RepID=A0AAW1YG17_RUBAR
MAYPPDLLSNILCRLRVQSLKRLQCVCKSWYAIISNPSFVTQHLDYHSKQKKNTHSCFLLSHYVDIRYSHELPIDQRKDTYFSLVNLDETTDEIVSLEWLKFSNYSDQENRFSNYWYEGICIFGPRNGIYCLLELSDNHGDVIALMNVSSREFKVVPKPEQSIIWHTGSVASRKFVEIGFDPKTNEYKVFFLKDPVYPKERVRQAAVYHVSSNSWKKLNDPLLNHVTILWNLTSVKSFISFFFPSLLLNQTIQFDEIIYITNSADGT